MEILYWHWIVLGIGLVLLELVIPSFTALWFGLGAIAVGLMLVFDPEFSLTVQITSWAVISAGLTTLWFKYLKPSKKMAHDITQNDVEGEMGLVIIKPTPHRNGKVRFSTPLLGMDEWDFKTVDDIDIGDQIQIVDIENGLLVAIKK
jgi:inner membrane protein